MEFIANNNVSDIISALMSGQNKITLDNVELILKPLKRDTTKNREREAAKVANSLAKLLG